jgi:hypothetical protein
MIYKFKAYHKRYKETYPVVCLNLGTMSDIILHQEKLKATFCADIKDVFITQYTNINDMTGKENYIDDIVKVKINNCIYHRKIYKSESGAYCIDLPVQNQTFDSPVLLVSIEHENVGSVYEKPELLK